MLVQTLKQFNTDNGSVDEMIELLVLGDLLVAKYQDFDGIGVELPEWIPSKLNSIRRELKNKQADYIERKLVLAKLKKESYKSEAQKKSDLSAEITRLKGLLDSMS